MNELTTTDEEETIPWRKLERTVFRLQQRIYRASCRGDMKTVHRLERLLSKSGAAELLARRGGETTLKSEGERIRHQAPDDQGLQPATNEGLSSRLPLNLTIDHLLQQICQGMNRNPQWVLTIHGLDQSSPSESCQLQLVAEIRNQATLISSPQQWVIFHEQWEVIQKCQNIVAAWFQTDESLGNSRHLQVSHTLNGETAASTGFNFLGFEIRHHQVGKHQRHSGTPGLKLVIQPSPERVKAQSQQLAEIIHAHKAGTQATLIQRLNPIIEAWANYYHRGDCQKTNQKLDYLLSIKLKRWARRRHPQQSNDWCTHRYWQMRGQGLCFMDARTGIELQKHSGKP